MLSIFLNLTLPFVGYLFLFYSYFALSVILTVIFRTLSVSSLWTSINSSFLIGIWGSYYYPSKTFGFIYIDFLLIFFFLIALLISSWFYWFFVMSLTSIYFFYNFFSCSLTSSFNNLIFYSTSLITLTFMSIFIFLYLLLFSS